ncbi:Hypothetical protein POVR2_LOCUS383 [uncultured virus]|nr:Hypothetical protein POVR2_LOCUS383 [uncultured virus]
MQNPDIFRMLVVSLDYESLLNLRTDLRRTEQLRDLFRDKYFWKEKTEHLAGKHLEASESADWVQIYHRVAQLVREMLTYTADEHTGTILDRLYEPALDNLDGLKIFLDLYPAEKSVEDNEERLAGFKIDNVDVLNWLFDNKYIDKTDDNAHYLLEAAIDMNNLELVQHLQTQVDTEGIAQDLLYWASMAGSYEVFEYLMHDLDYQLSARMVLQVTILAPTANMLQLAIDRYGIESECNEQAASCRAFHQPVLTQALIDVSGNYSEASADIARILLQHVDLERKDLVIALRAAIDNYNKWVLGALLDIYPDLCKYVTTSLLLESCRDADISDMIPTILRCVDPSYNNNQPLLTAVRAGNHVAIKHLLADSRVVLDRLSKSTIDGVLNILLPNVQTSQPKLLLFMLTKSASRLEVFDWMIGRHERQFQVAASNVLAAKTVSNSLEKMMRAALYKDSAIEDDELVSSYFSLPEVQQA